jgi:magnesium-protoporphyrin O-methyltransferase
MLDPSLGRFDHVLAMDSLIHYVARDMVASLAQLVARTEHSLVFTFAPRTPLLATMHTVGGFFPRANRAPRIEPVAEGTLRAEIAGDPLMRGWRFGRTQRIKNGFYTSQAAELVR